jgi:hypothetical protein
MNILQVRWIYLILCTRIAINHMVSKLNVVSPSKLSKFDEELLEFAASTIQAIDHFNTSEMLDIVTTEHKLHITCFICRRLL